MNSQNIQVVALIRAVLLLIWNLSVIVALSKIKDYHSKNAYMGGKNAIYRVCVNPNWSFLIPHNSAKNNHR